MEYLPASSLSLANAVLHEFASLWHDMLAAFNAKQSERPVAAAPHASAAAPPAAPSALSGRFVAVEPSFSDYQLPASFSLQHCALQLGLAAAFLMAARP